MDEQEEARRLVQLFAQSPAGLVQFLGMQLAAVKTYAQVLIGLCGLTITVTGFSGAHMIRSSSLSASLMVGGIASVFVGLVLCLRAVTGLRWVSEDLRDDLTETARACIARRNRQQRWVRIAAVFVGGGLLFYLAAVSVAALVPAGNYRLG
ncbi:MAG: hypothetical protein U0359_00490 [Byssovorax sp.]